MGSINKNSIKVMTSDYGDNSVAGKITSLSPKSQLKGKGGKKHASAVGFRTAGNNSVSYRTQ